MATTHRSVRQRIAAFQSRVHELLEVSQPDDRVSQILDYVIIGLILLNTAALILSTVDPIYAVAPKVFYYIETVSVSIFIAEYLLRIWACVTDAGPQYSHPIIGRLRFARSPLLLIDLIAIVPFFFPFLGIDDLRIIRSVRLLARAARLARYFRGMRTVGTVLRSKSDELLAVLLVLGVMFVLASALIYFVEHQAQPEAFASIPEAMWWSVITLTTVGYGDVSPVTSIGKALAGVIAIMGIGMFALPAGILGSGFLEEISGNKFESNARGEAAGKVCPHCGEKLEE